MIDLLLWLAVLPPAILFYRVLKLDKVEQEPFGLVARTFLLGCLSCIPAALIEAVGDNLALEFMPSEAAYNVFVFLLLVPLAEEGVKYLAMRTVRKNEAFNYTFDGIVYGVAASLGFATLENILYVVGLFDIVTAVARAFLSIPLHCVCGVFMGYYYGLGHRYRLLGEADKSRSNYILALVIPAIIHGLYDYSLSVDNGWISLAGLLFTFAMFVLAVKRVRLSSAQDEAFWGSTEQHNAATQPVQPAQPVQTTSQAAGEQWQPLSEEWQPRPTQVNSDRDGSGYTQKGGSL